MSATSVLMVLALAGCGGDPDVTWAGGELDGTASGTPVAVVPNLDDDDDDGTPDAEDPPSDDDDFALLELVVKRGATVSLEGTSLEILFDGDVVLEPGDSWEVPEKGTSREPLQVWVQATALDAQGVLTVERKGDDLEIPLHGAPLLLNHHLQQTEAVWVMPMSSPFYGNNTDMVASLQDVLGDRLTRVPAQAFDFDVWVQDEVELGTFTGADERVDIVVDSIRNNANTGGLHGVAKQYFARNTDFVRTFGSGFATTYDSFGNLEVGPPVTVDGVDYPAGRAYYGFDGSTGIVSEMRELLDREGLQAPIGIDTTWLCVGHVDEFTSFVPDKTAPRGFRLLYADTAAGYKLLDGLDEDINLPRYSPAPPYGHGISTSGELQDEEAVRAYNERIQADHLDPILDELIAGFGLSDEEVIRWPSIFEEVVEPGFGACGGLALVPGSVNLLLVNEPDGSSVAVMADPFFRADGAAASQDPFIQEYERLLPEEVKPVWVDDWDVYHLGMGEVHCGTNTRRTQDIEWWTEGAHLLGGE